MPNPGIIDAALIAECRAVIDAQFGPIVPGIGINADAYRQKLAICIAKAAQYVRDNAIVNPGQTVAPASFNINTTPVTGEGLVDSEGSLS